DRTLWKNYSPDPILKGDKLFNPTWDPDRKKHVAVAGFIDLVGDGKDGLEDFRRMLARQGAVVDAYVDLKDGSVQGKGITSNTESLILGDGLDQTRDDRSRDKELVAKVDRSIQALKKKAPDSGVAVISLRRYLEMTGYRAPRVESSRSNTNGYR